MQKTDAVAAMGTSTLLLPAWIKSALAANDRIKLGLSVLQAAVAHADHPDAEQLDLRAEATVAGNDAKWLLAMPASSTRGDGDLLMPEFAHLAKFLAKDLVAMARPLLVSPATEEHLRVRVAHWIEWLTGFTASQGGDERLTPDQLRALTNGERGPGKEPHSGEGKTRDGEHRVDSLHLLVMDLHKQINRLAASLATELISGAHVWELLPADRPRIEAFMRGLNRTAPLKLDHPGLDTAATRDGPRLMLQNDIGTNDAHVLVMQVEGTTLTLHYSDLHRPRFEFFQGLLAPFGAAWGALQAKVDATLNEGHPYSVGTATFACIDAAALDHALEGIGSRLVFLIDWNRARKRLLPFVGKAAAIAVLAEVARLDVGHMAWLKAGADRLLFDAMQADGEAVFRVGDRLDEVLGAADASAFLIEVMSLASRALVAAQPVALVADETRMLLARRMRQRSSEFDLIEEHAAYCHALAQAVSDGLAHGIAAPTGEIDHEAARKTADALAARAKRWERQADHLVMRARDQARRQPRWQPFARLLERSDDIADALEEAAFLIGLIADDHRQGWNAEVRDVLSRLAQEVLSAMQEHIKALAIARRLGAGSDAADSDAFLAASWSVLRSERACDELLRSARRAILAAVRDAASLMLANDLAMTLELASDHLLVAGYALRELAFDQARAGA
jgi:uncharacterized protein Yka (UPF0111/DUF47 family)